ncbi:MAG: protein kinase [Myxococcota bacterium]
MRSTTTLGPDAPRSKGLALFFDEPGSYCAAFENELERGQLFLPCHTPPPVGTSLTVALEVRRLGTTVVSGTVERAGVDAQGTGGVHLSVEANPHARQLYERCRAPHGEGRTLPHGAQEPAPTEGGDSLAPGQLIDGRFRIERHLASGGMGGVYEATHVYMRRRVAVKLLNPTFASSTEMAVRFQREAEIVGRLESPNVVKVFDFGRTAAGQLFLVMELVEGPTLDRVLIDEGALPPARAVSILTQIGEAVVEAHERGIVHRDLKPSNVILARRPDGTDFPKVLDFGIARLLDTPLGKSAGITQAGVVLGSPGYLAPELALGRADIDARVDIYALGVMAFELLTGQPPFVSDSLQSLIQMHLNAPPPAPEHIRSELALWPALCRTVLTALAKDRAQRFPDMRAMIRALSRSLAEPASATTRTTPSSATPTCPFCGAASVPGETGCGTCGIVLALPSGGDVTTHVSPWTGSRHNIHRHTHPTQAWAPVAVGTRTQEAAPRSPSTTTGAPSAGMPGNLTRTATRDGRALADTLDRLAPLVPKPLATTLLEGRVKGFGRRQGVVVLARLHGLPQLAASGADFKEAALLPRRCLAALVQIAANHGAALDWLDHEEAVLLFDEDERASPLARAARAALAIRDVVLEERSRTRNGASLSARVTLAHGAFAMLHDQGACKGPALDVATRLLDRVPAGGVGLDAALSRLSTDGYVTRTAEDGTVFLEDAPASFVRRASPRAGRTREMDALETAVLREATKSPRAALVMGAPGMGKTLLLLELAFRAQSQGFLVAWARGPDTDEPPPPILGLPALLAGLCSLPEPDLVELLPGVLAELKVSPAVAAAALATVRPQARVAPHLTPGEAAHVLLSVGQAAAAGRPLLLVFDDLDAAQPATHELFRLLTARAGADLAVVGSARSLAPLGRGHTAPVVTLEAWEKMAVEEAVRSLLPEHPLPAQLLTFIRDRSGGIPEAVEDWVHLLVDWGFLIRKGGYQLTGTPRSITASERAAARVDAVGGDARRFLEAGVLLGKRFERDLVERAVTTTTVSAVWERLERAGLVRPCGAGYVETPSARHRAAVELRCTGTGRAALHARLVDALHASSGTSRPVGFAPRLAYHLAHAGELMDALSWWQGAAASAIERRDPRAAALHLRACAAALERAPGSNVLSPAQSTTLRVRFLTRGTALALAAEDQHLANGLFHALPTGGVAEGVEPLAEAERLVVLARLHRMRGEVAASAKMLAWVAQTYDNAAIQALVNVERAELHAAAGNSVLAAKAFDLAARTADHARVIAPWHGEVDLRARMDSRLADQLFLQGDRAGALEAYRRALVGFQQARHPLAEARVMASLGALAAQESRPVEAARLFARAAEVAEGAGDLLFEAQALLRLAQAKRQANDLPGTVHAAHEAVQLAARLHWTEGVRLAEAAMS